MQFGGELRCLNTALNPDKIKLYIYNFISLGRFNKLVNMNCLLIGQKYNFLFALFFDWLGKLRSVLDCLEKMTYKIQMTLDWIFIRYQNVCCDQYHLRLKCRD